MGCVYCIVTLERKSNQGLQFFCTSLLHKMQNVIDVKRISSKQNGQSNIYTVANDISVN